MHYLCMQPTTIMTVIIKGSFNSSWRLQYAVEQIRKKKARNRSVGLGNVRKRTWILLFSSFFSRVCIPQRAGFCFASFLESNAFQMNGAGRIGTEIQQCIRLKNASYLFQTTLCSRNTCSSQVYLSYKIYSKWEKSDP